MGKRALLGIAERTLHRVFELSGVSKSHAHRFRHTLAIEVLRSGGTLADVARVLGNTPEIVARHYSPWCQALQDRVREIMQRVHQSDTPELHRGYTEKKGLPIQ